MQEREKKCCCDVTTCYVCQLLHTVMTDQTDMCSAVSIFFFSPGYLHLMSDSRVGGRGHSFDERSVRRCAQRNASGWMLFVFHCFMSCDYPNMVTAT